MVAHEILVTAQRPNFSYFVFGFDSLDFGLGRWTGTWTRACQLDQGLIRSSLRKVEVLHLVGPLLHALKLCSGGGCQQDFGVSPGPLGTNWVLELGVRPRGFGD